MMQYFEWNLPNDGNLWKNLKEDAKHLHEIGITAVWIPPAYKADEQQDEGYATYDLFDLGEFEQQGTVRTKYGTKQELKEAIDELHRYQISVYLDTVLNHKVKGDYTETFQAVEVDPANREKSLGEPHDIQGWTGYNFPGRNKKYSDFEWHFYHFTGTEYDDITRKTGIFRILGKGKDWAPHVNVENGNFDFLLGNDIDLKHPDVINELNKWSAWVTEELQLDGFRMDALKHMEATFTKQFLDRIQSIRPEGFFAVGEYWDGSFDTLKIYLDFMGYNLSLFDVPFHYKMQAAGIQGKDFDFTKFPEDTLVARFPQNAVTFVDNHDSQEGSSLESQVADWFKPIAYGLILLMEKGYPCVFYGDYYGMKGIPSPHQTILDILLNARKTYAYGPQDLYFDHPNTVGFVRKGDAEHPGSGLALLISNSENGYKIMNVGPERKGEVWYEITQNITEEVTIDEEGNGKFLVNGGKLAVWVQKK